MSNLYPRGFLLSHLSGEARLFSAWWVFYVLGKVVLYLPVGGFFAWVLISKRFHELDMVLFKQVALGWFCLLVLHGLLASWVVWRCASNSSSPVWTWLARGVVILSLPSLAGGLAGVSALSPSGDALLVELAQLDLLTLTQHTEAAGDTISLAQRMVQLAASQQAGHPFVLVRREGRVVAYANYSPHESVCWFVLMLNIHPAWRTPAVLGELLRDSGALFAERGVERLVSHVYRTNAASVRFHRRLGFTVAKENTRGFEFHARVADLMLPERLGGLQQAPLRGVEPAAPIPSMGYGAV